MKKSIFWTGVIISILGIILSFLTKLYINSPRPEPGSSPGTNQIYWIGLTIMGIILLIVGSLMKKK